VKGVILAAGRGSRLDQLTDERPKCLVRLGGRPLLHWQLEALAAAGAEAPVVVAGYRAELLRDSRWTTVIAPRWHRTNMVRSLQSADEWLRVTDCVVSYGDIIYTAATVRRLMRSPTPLAITYDPNWLGLWCRRFSDPLVDAETFRRSPDGMLTEIGARPTTLDDVQGQYMGLLKISPAGWMSVEQVLRGLSDERIDRLDLTALLRLLVERGHHIDTVPCVGDWAEVDSPSDLLLYEEMLASGELVIAPGVEDVLAPTDSGGQQPC
jgi:choline kinase